jgi:methyl-accepting chemotaxis protein
VASTDSELVATLWRLGVIDGIATAFILLVLCGTVYWCLVRFVTKPVSIIVAGLDNNAAQVSDSSRQLSEAAVQLSDGVTEEAASLEETSASLEEVSSMAKQNADNAGQCNSLMGEVNTVVEKANRSMVAQTTAMTDISEASNQTSKIVKTIDEIAFQTNLLALNAAVEAARAGEAGAGFAVVADEVRNLAMRAAEAARNTANLIEGTVAKVNEGEKLLAQTNADFSEVAGMAVKVGGLVNEIAVASNEQTQGLSQINTAIADIDRVTQQTAASSEEAAAAAEVLSSQAELLKQHVEDLIGLVSGTRERADGERNVVPYDS